MGGEEDEMEKTASSLQFTPGAIRHFSFTFLALPEDVGRNIEVGFIAINFDVIMSTIKSLHNKSGRIAYLKCQCYYIVFCTLQVGSMR